MNKQIPDETLNQLILSALKEDIGLEDITTNAIFQQHNIAVGYFLAKANGIVAGIDVVKKVFSLVDERINIEVLIPDGSKVKKGDIIANVNGPAISLLTAERVALNFIQRMSGIATLTNKYVEILKGTNTKILDTRKTVPGLRLIDKLAVKLGGGENHRSDLSELFLIKDNHIDIAGSLTEAVNRCLKYKETKYPKVKIEVETTSLDLVREAIKLPVDIIMLDNMTIPQMTEAVKIINGKCKTEASGGINLDTVRNIALTGVDYISIGALTHSISALDISLELKV